MVEADATGAPDVPALEPGTGGGVVGLIGLGGLDVSRLMDVDDETLVCKFTFC